MPAPWGSDFCINFGAILAGQALQAGSRSQTLAQRILAELLSNGRTTSDLLRHRPAAQHHKVIKTLGELRSRGLIDRDLLDSRHAFWTLTAQGRKEARRIKDQLPPDYYQAELC